MQRKLLGIINMDFDAKRSATDHIFCIRHILEKNGNKSKQRNFPFIRLQESYDLVRKDVLHNILIQYGFPINLVSLIRIEESG